MESVDFNGLKFCLWGYFLKNILLLFFRERGREKETSDLTGRWLWAGCLQHALCWVFLRQWKEPVTIRVSGAGGLWS